MAPQKSMDSRVPATGRAKHFYNIIRETPIRLIFCFFLLHPFNPTPAEDRQASLFEEHPAIDYRNALARFVNYNRIQIYFRDIRRHC